jgi:hypothetical protein
MSYAMLVFAILPFARERSNFVAISDEREPVVMVLDVVGDVNPRRMALLRGGDLVRMPESARVRLVFLGDGHRETLSKAGTVTIAESGCMPADAAIREKSAVPTSRLPGLRAFAPSSRAGVTRLKELEFPGMPQSPINGARVLQDRPCFAWVPVPAGDSCNVRVFRGESAVEKYLLWSVRSANDRLDFPRDRPPLSRGEKYTWTVAADGKGTIAVGRFTVAAKDAVSDLETVREMSHSPDAADRLLAATLFEAASVFDESHRLFADLAKQFPAEPWVLLASARHFARIGDIDQATSRARKALELTGSAQGTYP